MNHAGPRPEERGFTLIEALVATGVLTVVLACTMGAVAVAVRAAHSAAPRSALAEIAQNVLADLRAATAYDPDELAALAATGVRRFTLEEPQADGSTAQDGVTEAVVPNASGAGYTASVTVDDAAGNAVTLHSTLVQEAPVPGSVVPLSTSPPVGGNSEQGTLPGGCDSGSAACRAPCLLGRGCKAAP